MIKKLIGNPVGLAITSVTLLLALSPEARRGTRKLLVKGAGAVLALGDQMKSLTSGVRKQIGSIMEEAKAEKEMMMLPDMTAVIKNSGEMVKQGIENGVEKTQQAAKSAKESIGNLFKDVQPAENDETFKAYNVINSQSIKQKLQEIEQQLH
jgi:ABC-type transporter MlaC component